MPMAAEEQKLSFQSIISDTLGEDCDYETVKTIHENLAEIIEESQDTDEILVLDKNKVRDLFEASGVSEELMETFDANFDSMIGKDVELVANNVTTKTFQVKTPNVIIKVDPEMAHLVETKEINGKNVWL